MKNSTAKTFVKASKRFEIGQIHIRHSLKVIVTGALLLAATGAMAGLLSSPMGVVYTNLEFAPVDIQNNGNGTVQIRTNGLTGELTIKGGDFPPEYDIATTSEVILPFDQALELDVDLSSGLVEGRASGQIHVNNENGFVIAGHTDSSGRGFMRLNADVRGNASCLPLNGLECGQLVVDLELRGVLTDPNDPSIVGKLRMEVLSSLFFDGSDVGIGSESGFWAAMSANASIGANEELITSVLQYAACKEALVIC